MTLLVMKQLKENRIIAHEAKQEIKRQRDAERQAEEEAEEETDWQALFENDDGPSVEEIFSTVFVCGVAASILICILQK